jgi:hypothetical protein
LAKGLYKLIDTTTGKELELPSSSSKSSPDLEPFITLPPDSNGHPVIHKLPLGASSWLQDLVTPNKTYRLELRDLEKLAFEWWHWGSKSDILPQNASHQSPVELPPASAGTIISKQNSCGIQFRVVSSIEPPPVVNIQLSSLPNGKSVLVTTSNPTSQIFTLKVSGHQPYSQRSGLGSESSDPPRDPSALVIAPDPALQSLSVIKSGTDDELIPEHPTFMCGGSGWARGQFLTLRPGDKVSREMELPFKRMEVGQDYRVRLRTKGCWWISGTIDELFSGVKEGGILKRTPAGPTLPVWLECDDEVTITYAG